MNITQTFIDLQLTARNVDFFLTRTAIFQAVQHIVPQLGGTLLDLGSGYQPYRTLLTTPPSKVTTYIAVDLKDNIYQRPDVEWDGDRLPFATATVDCVIATEVLEHCPHPDHILHELWRVLRPGGLFFFTVPFLWPLHTAPYDQYRYTSFALYRHLSEAGFTQIDITAMGGWDRSMAQMLGLWAKRRWRYADTRSLPQRLFKRLAPYAVLPIIAFLDQQDQIPDAYADQIMPIGFAGSASK